MDKLTTYRSLVKQVLSKYTALVNRQPTPGVETICIFDEERGHYLLVTVGWSQGRRVRNTTLYVRLHDEKFWIEEDWTEEGIAMDFVRAGVPKEDIVLAFQPPEVRSHTEFASVP
jgi:XisI protein